MAEKALTPQELRSSGVEPTYLTSASTPALATGSFPSTGDQFTVANNGRTWLRVKNGATALNITIQTPVTLDGNALADRVVAVPANEERDILLSPREVYGDPAKFALDSVANVEIAVLRVP